MKLQQKMLIHYLKNWENIMNKQPNNNFRFKHSLGQNFIKDEVLLNSILDDAEVVEDSLVLEIGAGAGALTQKLCERASKGKIVSVEIDKTLTPILNKKLAKFDNLNLIFDDILKLNPSFIKQEFNNQPFKVVANLPYYITTPILEYLLNNNFKITDITVMVQLEVAQRLSASVGTKDYGAITAILNMYGTTQITQIVNKRMFTPMPKVDSAILHIVLNSNYDVDKQYVAEVVKKCFSMRRKTLQNNLCSSFNLDKQQAQNIIENDLKRDVKIRAEMLDLNDFIKLADILKKLN